LSRPRSRNCRNPSADLMTSNTVPGSACVARRRSVGDWRNVVISLQTIV
jgi:hypothetical protein